MEAQMDQEKKFIEEGELSITVTKDVIGHLSVGLYRNFARAVKELISNAYDAGATEVKIKLDLESTPTRMIIRDNGRGMNKGDVENKFLKIGIQTVIDEDVDDLGRKRIGTFGIGCISVFPYCDTIRVISKKINEDKILEVNIDANRFFKGGTFDIGTDEKSKVPYKSFKSDLPVETGETIIILENLKDHIVTELKHKDMSGDSSIEKFSGFRKFKWTLAQYAPIQFPVKRTDLRNFFTIPNRVPMRVWVNGEELFRNVPEDAQILEKSEKQFNGIQLKYAIMTPIEPIRPGEAKGLQLRLRDVAIGLPTDFDIISLTGKVPGKLNWICGEIHILDGLASALMIDRDSLLFTEGVAAIHDFFRKRLRHWNDRLESQSFDEKEIYRSVLGLEDSENVISVLKTGGILKIPKERLRIKKADLTKSTKKGVLSTKEELKRTLTKSGYKVIPKKGIVPRQKSPVEVDSKTKSIFIYEDHQSLREKLQIGSKLYPVEYESWDLGKTPFDICKILDDRKTVVFNRTHPLFKSKLDDKIIKKLTLGILLITEGRKDQGSLVEKINKLLTEVLLG